MTLWRIAWRNLGRNRRRTAVTASAIGFGVALCVVTYGLMDGLSAQMVRSVTKLDLGHVQVHHPEYPKRRLMRMTIPDAAPLLEAAEARSEVRGASARVYGWGLISHGKSSTGVELVGVDPRRERVVTELLDLLPEGQQLPDEPTPWPEGRELTAEEQALDEKITADETAAALAELDALDSIGGGGGNGGDDRSAGTAEKPAPSEHERPGAAAAESSGSRDVTMKLVRDIAPPPDAPPPIVIGEKLAHSLKVKPGDRVYMLSGTIDGLTAEEQFRVAGVFRTGQAVLDRSRVYLHLNDVQHFLRLGDRVHEVAIAVDVPELAEGTARGLAGVAALSELLVRPWQDVKPLLRRMLQMNDVGVGIMLGIIFFIAALGVLNTMLMAVFERTRELGVLSALGLRGSQVLRLIIIETVLLAVVGGAVGTLIGLGLDGYLVYHGWDLSDYTRGYSMGGIGVDPVMYAVITVKGVVTPLLAMSIVSLLASLYPAARAARLRPTEAMRHT